jgi:hypothetical protein
VEDSDSEEPAALDRAKLFWALKDDIWHRVRPVLNDHAFKLVSPDRCWDVADNFVPNFVDRNNLSLG